MLIVSPDLNRHPRRTRPAQLVNAVLALEVGAILRVALPLRTGDDRDDALDVLRSRLRQISVAAHSVVRMVE